MNRKINRNMNKDKDKNKKTKMKIYIDTASGERSNFKIK